MQNDVMGFKADIFGVFRSIGDMEVDQNIVVYLPARWKILDTTSGGLHTSVLRCSSTPQLGENSRGEYSIFNIDFVETAGPMGDVEPLTSTGFHEPHQQ